MAPLGLLREAQVASRIISPRFWMRLMIFVPPLPGCPRFSQPARPLSVLHMRVAEDGVGSATVPRDDRGKKVGSRQRFGISFTPVCGIAYGHHIAGRCNL